MNILVCGGNGFIGKHILQSLIDRGHNVIATHSKLSNDKFIQTDFRNMTEIKPWEEILTKYHIEAVINTVGIFKEEQPGDFELLHYQSPLALFNACHNQGIKKIIQISALGNSDTPYFKTKLNAEKELQKIIPSATIIRPSLIFGADGFSTKSFLILASLPVQITPAKTGLLQPIHINDLVSCVLKTIDNEIPGIIDACGHDNFQFKDLLKIYRKNLGLTKTLSVPIPNFIINTLSKISGLFSNSILTRDSWLMLKNGSNGDNTKIQNIIGHELIKPSFFIKDSERELLKYKSLKSWQNIFLRLTLSFIWFFTAITSAFIFPLNESLALLKPFEFINMNSLFLLYFASSLDLFMGIITLFKPSKKTWISQILLITGYTILIAFKLPEYMIHPFGPILKNVAIIAILINLYSEEEN